MKTPQVFHPCFVYHVRKFISQKIHLKLSISLWQPHLELLFCSSWPVLYPFQIIVSRVFLLFMYCWCLLSLVYLLHYDSNIFFMIDSSLDFIHPTEEHVYHPAISFVFNVFCI